MNVGESAELALAYAEHAGVSSPVLLDSEGRWHTSYGLEDGYAPFPVQVVIDRDGVITYIGRQYDVQAARRAIDEALGR